MKKNNFLRVLVGIIRGTVAIIFVSFIIVVCLQRFSNNRISFFDYRMFAVITESMKPKYIKGDVLISKKVDPKTIKEGDVVVYLGKEGSFKDKVVTHQVVWVDVDKEGKYVFRTKGIANPIEDPLVSEDQIYGKIIYKVFILSTIYRIIANPIGFYFLVFLPILYIISSEIIITLVEREKKRRGITDNKEASQK